MGAAPWLSQTFQHPPQIVDRGNNMNKLNQYLPTNAHDEGDTWHKTKDGQPHLGEEASDNTNETPRYNHHIRA